MFAEHLPSPAVAQQYRCENLYRARWSRNTRLHWEGESMSQQLKGVKAEFAALVEELGLEQQHQEQLAQLKAAQLFEKFEPEREQFKAKAQVQALQKAEAPPNEWHRKSTHCTKSKGRSLSHRTLPDCDGRTAPWKCRRPMSHMQLVVGRRICLCGAVVISRDANDQERKR